MEIQKILANIFEKVLDFNKTQKGKRLPLDWAKYIKILTPKQII